jgi:hypothetical protein
MGESDGGVVTPRSRLFFWFVILEDAEKNGIACVGVV